MSVVLLYLLLLKATVTSFAGLGSLPQIQRDLVKTHHLLTDEQLSEAVIVGRSTPGPIGAYVVAVGYFAAGWPGAIAGWLAMITPAFAVLPLMATIRRWLYIPHVRAAVDAIIIASGVLLVGTGVRLINDVVDQFSRFL